MEMHRNDYKEHGRSAEYIQEAADQAQDKVDDLAKLKTDTIEYFKSGLKRLHVNVGPKTLADGEMYIADAIDDILHSEVARLASIISEAPDTYQDEVESLYRTTRL